MWKLLLPYCCFFLLSIGNNAFAAPVSINLADYKKYTICTGGQLYHSLENSVMYSECSEHFVSHQNCGCNFLGSREILRVPLLLSSPSVLSRRRIMSCFPRIWIGDANNYSDRIWGPDLKVRFIPLQ